MFSALLEMLALAGLATTLLVASLLLSTGLLLPLLILARWIDVTIPEAGLLRPFLVALVYAPLIAPPVIMLVLLTTALAPPVLIITASL